MNRFFVLRATIFSLLCSEGTNFQKVSTEMFVT